MIKVSRRSRYALPRSPWQRGLNQITRFIIYKTQHHHG